MSTSSTELLSDSLVTPTLDIRPSRGWVNLGLAELWAHRELLYFLTWREIKIRYKQTALGVAWAVIQPLFSMLIFSIFFGRLGKIPSDGVPYPLFVFAGLVPWMFFSNALSNSSNSVVNSAHLITKIYFPRLALPVSSILSGAVDFGLSFLLLLCLMLYYGVTPTTHVFWLPLLFLLAAITALGVGLWLSALNVGFRDIKYAVPFLAQMWLFATPIAYPSSLLSDRWRALYGLNPMAGVVEGFRWSLLNTGSKPGVMVLISAAAAVFLLVSGAYYFRRMERTFADTV
jgi:lipopolysaccharide transport system permease protein